MRHTDVTRSSGSYMAAPGAVPAADRVNRRATGGSLFWRAFEVLFTAMERRKQRNALSGLDEHLLKDIGISRAEVEQEVSKPFWRG